MKKPKLFQYAVVWHPTTKEEKDGRVSEVLVQPTTVVFPDKETALEKLSEEVKGKYEDSFEQAEIVITPFA